jgi:tetratricopeptide (TPR) repeat protein
VAECSAALDGQPNFFKALIRRAKAYEQLGQHKQALADLQRANKLDTATADSRVRGSRSPLRAGGPGGVKPACGWQPAVQAALPACLAWRAGACTRTC